MDKIEIKRGDKESFISFTERVLNHTKVKRDAYNIHYVSNSLVVLYRR